MKILHTADWHIGQHLHTRKRYTEFEQFFEWLVGTISSEQIDVLLIAGDVFDTTTPSHQAQQLYNNFLASVAKTNCRHVVVIGGNHDSPTLLNAQRNLFKLLQIHVVGCAEACLKDEVLLLHDQTGTPELIVCAVPYLRDRDIRKAEPGETLEIKGKKLIEGVRQHYAEVCQEAERIRESLTNWVPIVAMGHLFTAGGKTEAGDGVRDLYVGSLGHIHSEIFPSCIDYLALGHLHTPQEVANNRAMRYAGSPLPISFTETNQIKEVVRVEFVDKQMTIESLRIPRFQMLKRICGDWESIFSEIAKEREENSQAFLEVIYTGGEFIDPKRYRELEESVKGSELEILKINNACKRERILAECGTSASLDDLQPLDVFRSMLRSEHVSENGHQDLIARFLEVVTTVLQEDSKAS